jgi:hypothetical protein
MILDSIGHGSARLNFGRSSRGGWTHGSGALDALAALGRIQGLPQVATALHVQPEISAVAKYARQHQGSISRYRAPVVAQLVDVLAWHAHRLGEVPLCQVERPMNSSIRTSPTLAGLRLVISMANLTDSCDHRDTHRMLLLCRHATGTPTAIGRSPEWNASRQARP